jgi:type I restriction enzyme S subunit
VITDTDKNEFTIPTGWIAESLGNLADKITKGATPTTYGYAFQRLGVNFIKVQNISNGYIDLCSITDFISEDAHQNQGKSILKVNDVLFSIAGTIGETAIVKSHHLPANTNQALAIISGFSKILIPKYLEFQLRSFVSQKTKDKARGGAMNNVSLDDLKSLKLLLPPYSEQQRIVAKIETLFSELDKGIESFKTAREQLKIYRQSLLKHAFSGKLTEQWRAENPDKLENAQALLQRIETERQQRYQQQLKDWEANDKQGSKPKALKTLPPLTTEELAALPELPNGWIYIRAEEISDFITKGTTPSKELLFEGNGEIPFIKVYNLTKTGFLDFSIDPTFVSRKTHNGFLARSKVYPGDVLMNIVGPPLGKVSIVPDSYPEWNINQAISIFRTNLISSRFLATYLAHEDTVRVMMKKSKATAGQFNLTLEICRETLIPFCGKNEQAEIENLIDAKTFGIDQLDQTITTALQQAEALRQSILKKAFSGQLVPQDPSDEPASVLLERIRLEKAALSVKPKSIKPKRCSL